MTAAHDTQALTLEDVKGAIRAAYDVATTSLFSGLNDPDAGASAALAHLTAAIASRVQEKEGQPALSAECILHLWDTHVGDPTEKLPLTRADKIAFARAALAAGSQAVQVPVWLSNAQIYGISARLGGDHSSSQDKIAFARAIIAAQAAAVPK